MVWEQMIQSRRQLATTRLKRLFMTSRQIMRLRICQHQPVWFFAWQSVLVKSPMSMGIKIKNYNYSGLILICLGFLKIG